LEPKAPSVSRIAGGDRGDRGENTERRQDQNVEDKRFVAAHKRSF